MSRLAGARLFLSSGEIVTLPRQGAPAPRWAEALALVDGRLFVWGGWVNGKGPVADGAMFDVRERRWIPIAALGAPSHRYLPIVVRMGTQVLVVGGLDVSEDACSARPAPGGATFDPAHNRWRAISEQGGPSGLVFPDSGSAYLPGTTLAAWTGRELLVSSSPARSAPFQPQEGGGQELFLYNPRTNRWRTVTQEGEGLPDRGQKRAFIEPNGRVLVTSADPFRLHELALDSAQLEGKEVPNELESRVAENLCWTGRRLFFLGGIRRSTWKRPPHRDGHGYDPPGPRYLGGLWVYRPK